MLKEGEFEMQIDNCIRLTDFRNTKNNELVEFDFFFFQVIHGLLDRTMQLLQVPLSKENGYHIRAIDGKTT